MVGSLAASSANTFYDDLNRWAQDVQSLFGLNALGTVGAIVGIALALIFLLLQIQSWDKRRKLRRAGLAELRAEDPLSGRRAQLSWHHAKGVEVIGTPSSAPEVWSGSLVESGLDARDRRRAEQLVLPPFRPATFGEWPPPPAPSADQSSSSGQKGVAAGWYPDPETGGRTLRYWDGSAWEPRQEYSHPPIAG